MKDLMDPETAIAPTKLIRRPDPAKKWHLWEKRLPDKTHMTRCGQHFGSKAVTKIAYNAKQIDCTDCMVVAIRQGRP